jgi:hypothetical protein
MSSSEPNEVLSGCGIICSIEVFCGWDWNPASVTDAQLMISPIAQMEASSL